MIKKLFEFLFEHETSLGEINILRVSASATFTHDPNFGADADGNRGYSMWSIDELDFRVLNDRGVDVTDLIEIENKRLYNKIEAHVEAHAVAEFEKGTR